MKQLDKMCTTAKAMVGSIDHIISAIHARLIVKEKKCEKYNDDSF